MNKPVSLRAEKLRLAFDQGFALPPPTTSSTERDLLAITLADGAYALELSDIAGLYTNKKVTRIPSHTEGLLGIAGFRGAILPVYDLAVLIGLAPLEHPKWVAVAAHTQVAIAFETFDGHVRIPQDDIAPNESTEGSRKHVRYLLRVSDKIRAVINMSSALQAVTTSDT